MADKQEVQKKQMEFIPRLQMMTLEHFEQLLKDKTITSTDLATLVRLLVHNGWVLDETRLPTTLRDKLTRRLDPADLSDEDGVVGKIA
jgi:hypothetical protein